MGTQDEGAADATAAGGADAKKNNIFEDRPVTKKIIRVVTVIAYLVSVSFVAIVLSAYYVFLWHPPNPRLVHRAQLKADPQMEYLVDKPPTEVTLNESLSPAEIRNKVNVFREEILRSRGINISFRSQHQLPQNLEQRAKSSNVSYVDHDNLRNGTASNDSRISGSLWNPIVRALLATTEAPTTRTALGDSTDIYKSFNVAMKSLTGTDSLRASTVFMETRKINGPSTTRVSFSASSPSSSLSESKGKLYNASANDFALTTATASTAGDTRSRDENRSSSHRLEKFNSVAESSIKGMTPTRAYELLESLGSNKMGLDSIGSSGIDQHKAGTTIGTSVIVEKATVGSVDPFGGSGHPQFLQGLNRTTTASGRRRDDQSKDLESTKQPNIIDSHITRVSTKSPTNDTKPLEKLRTDFPSEKQAPIEIFHDPTRDVESVPNSPASIVPAVVQPDPESIGREQESEEQLTQDGDFGFI